MFQEHHLLDLLRLTLNLRPSFDSGRLLQKVVIKHAVIFNQILAVAARLSVLLGLIRVREDLLQSLVGQEPNDREARHDNYHCSDEEVPVIVSFSP